MYEWSELFNYNIVPFGRFVAFDKNDPGKIKLARKGDYIIGVTTINAVITSDDPEEWQGKYLCNEYGDILVNNENYNPFINDKYNNERKYIKRSDRNEWIRVNLLGKCIVVDNGECQPGNFCTIGNNGIAEPSDPTILSRGILYADNWYVLDRLTENTIMIFFK
jgi:hypothetical protein